MNRENTIDRIFVITNTAIIILVLILTLYPLIFVVSASISDPLQVYQGNLWLLPKGITFEGYVRVFRNNEIWTGYRNTIFYAVLGTCINLFVTLTCAYSFSRSDFVGRNFFMGLFTFTMFFSGGLIPTYILIKNLGLIDTVWALLIPNAASVWNIIISRTYIQNNIPLEIQEAAVIDGCRNSNLFTRIVLPLSTPIIAVMVLFYGVGHWNSYFSAMLYISNRTLFPLQLILREILVQNQMSSQMVSSGGDLEALAVQAKMGELIKYSVMIVSTLPLLMVYPFLQKYFTQGIMIGAIKG